MIVFAAALVILAFVAPHGAAAKSPLSLSASVLDGISAALGQIQAKLGVLAEQVRAIGKPKSLPDLWVAALGWNGDPALLINQPVQFTAVIINQGQADIEKSFTARIGDAAERIDGLKVNETVSITKKLVFSKLGVESVRVIADAENEVRESDEANNVFVKNIKIVPR